MSRLPSDVGGYVLAGGKSSRMGRDKALLELAGKPLALHAVEKLRRVCADVHILSNRAELGKFAPLIRDLHENCGPLGGMEAALAHSPHAWNLFLPVDVPFLPSSFLNWWVRQVVAREETGARVAIFTVNGRPQAALCLIHRDVASFVGRAVEREDFKLFPVLEGAGKELAERQGVLLGSVFVNLPWGDASWFSAGPGDGMGEPTEAQLRAKHLWFANVNTPEEFAEAERQTDALET